MPERGKAQGIGQKHSTDWDQNPSWLSLSGQGASRFADQCPIRVKNRGARKQIVEKSCEHFGNQESGPGEPAPQTDRLGAGERGGIQLVNRIARKADEAMKAAQRAEPKLTRAEAWDTVQHLFLTAPDAPVPKTD